jgi:ribosome maturation factor RimP
MITKEKISDLIRILLTEKEAFVVSLEISAADKITLVIDSMKGVGIDDCIEFSKAIESGLDRETEDFELEVSSAGLGTPYKVLQQYYKNLGKEIEIVLKSGIKLKGILKEVDESGIVAITEKMAKVEGKKKKQLLIENKRFTFDELSRVYNIVKL